MSTLSVRLPESLHRAAKDLAKKEHVSINQLFTLAIAEKLSALETDTYLSERSKRGDRSRYLKVLNGAPDVEPKDEDKL